MNRLHDFLEILYKKHLLHCRYDVLREEAEHFFQTSDPRTIESYIGRPANIKRYSGLNIVRLNRQTGETAKFDYMNERKIPVQKGLGQRYGYITIQKPTSPVEAELWIIHHELMNYFSEQSILEPVSESANLLPERERLDVELVSKDSLFVCLIDDRDNPKEVVEHPLARSLQRDANMSTETDIDGEKRERAIEDTNKYVQVSNNTNLLEINKTQKINKNIELENNAKLMLELIPEAETLLHAKPSEEPDKAQIRWSIPGDQK